MAKIALCPGQFCFPFGLCFASLAKLFKCPSYILHLLTSTVFMTFFTETQPSYLGCHTQCRGQCDTLVKTWNHCEGTVNLVCPAAVTHSIAKAANNQKKAKGRGHWLAVQWPTICLPMYRGHRFDPLVQEVRSHMLSST